MPWGCEGQHSGKNVHIGKCLPEPYSHRQISWTKWSWVEWGRGKDSSQCRTRCTPQEGGVTGGTTGGPLNEARWERELNQWRENNIGVIETWNDRSARFTFQWPYCAKRCTYCNFNKYINRDVQHPRMRKCLVSETSALLNLSGVARINSIFFGGGLFSFGQDQHASCVVWFFIWVFGELRLAKRQSNLLVVVFFFEDQALRRVQF